MSISDLDSDVHVAANEIAGNWKKFDSFAWSGEPEEDSDDYAIVYLSDRDSGCLDKSNEAAILKSLRETDPNGEHWHEERYSHWAVGYVDGIVIRVRVNGEPTPAFKVLHECAMALANYPVLDDSDFSEREAEEENEAWSNWGARDFRRALASLPGHSHEVEFFEVLSDETLRVAWEKINPNGEWVIHESDGCYFPFDSSFGARAGACVKRWPDVRTALQEAIIETMYVSKCCAYAPGTAYLDTNGERYRGISEQKIDYSTGFYCCSKCGGTNGLRRETDEDRKTLAERFAARR